MLEISAPLSEVEGRIENDFETPQAWARTSFAPDDPNKRQLFFLLGDETCGPAIVLSHAGPEKTPKGPEFYSSIPPHLHRTPTFRISIGRQAEQMLLNKKWFGDGDYWILDANKFYNDPNGNDGYAIFNLFADRRGVFPAFRIKPGMTREGMDAMALSIVAPMDEMVAFHASNDQAIGGGAISTREGLDHGGQASGSIHDQSGWTTLADGSRMAVVVLGDARSGPLLLMSGNAPGAVESPAAQYGVDTFRLVVRGSCTIAEKAYRAGQFVAFAAGQEIGPVVHGPEGSTQLLAISDRRGWKPVDRNGAPIASARLDEIARVVGRVCEA